MSIQRQYNGLSLNDRIGFQNEAGLPKWGPLYRIAGMATIVMLILLPIQIAVFSIWPTPTSVLEWFLLLQSNWMIGLMHLDLLYIVNNTIVAVMYLALYLSLRQRNEALMLIALGSGLLGIASYYASNPAFEMLSLSRQFAICAESEKAILIAAGQAMIVQWKGTAFDIYYILSAICLILMAGVMFQSAIYGKTMATIGLLSGILMLIPSTAGTLGLYFSLASLVPWAAFSVLAAVRFFGLGSISISPSPAEMNGAHVL